MQTVPDQLHIAHEYEQKGDLGSALKVAQSVLTKNPDDPLTMLMTGHLLFMLVRLPEARQTFEKLLAAHPEDSKARYSLAEILDNPLTVGRDRAMAENILLEMLQRDPKDVKAYTKLGTIYSEQGHFRQAAYISVLLLEQTPDSAAARLQLAQAYTKLNDTQSAQAQQEIAQRLLARDREEAQLQADTSRQPKDGMARLKLAKHYVNAGQYARALPALQAARCLAPGNQAVQNELTNLYQKLQVPLPNWDQ
jgi:predicted Zn-dependent protease